MHWELNIDPKIEKQMKRFPPKERVRLFGIIQELALNPYAGDIEKMKGEADVWRRSVGSYRIKYEIYPFRKIVRVFSVERRASRTY